MSSVTVDQEQLVRRAIEAHDQSVMHRDYWLQNEFVCMDRFFPAALVDEWAAEADRLRLAINRNYVPRHKKGGSVSYYDVRRQAPAILALYRSPILRTFLSRIVEAPLLLCPEQDPHACALYFYTDPGDHIGFHYDTSYYKGRRYTLLVGLRERSQQCRLVARLYKDQPNREIREMRIPMDPGTVVAFNGDKLWHAVTPLEEGAERIVLTLQYVTDQTIGPVKRLFSNMKDAFAYFGPSALLKSRPSRARRDESCD